MTEHIGFIGLGNMGSPMAEQLVLAGHDVEVFDLNPASLQKAADFGARPAASVQKLAKSADCIFVSSSPRSPAFTLVL